MGAYREGMMVLVWVRMGMGRVEYCRVEQSR